MILSLSSFLINILTSMSLRYYNFMGPNFSCQTCIMGGLVSKIIAARPECSSDIDLAGPPCLQNAIYHIQRISSGGDPQDVGQGTAQQTVEGPFGNSGNMRGDQKSVAAGR